MRLCTIDECGEKHWAQGYCHDHYQRWWRTGYPEGRPAGIESYADMLSYDKRMGLLK